MKTGSNLIQAARLEFKEAQNIVGFPVLKLQFREPAHLVALYPVGDFKKLSEYKHPLDIRRGVRKGVKKRMADNQPSKQLKGAGRTYFLDVQKTREGKSYLRITESRKGEGDKFERNSINVFPEDAKEFAQAVSEMTDELE